MHAVIIGAGIGGIAAAIRAARKGYTVSVYEAAATPGGKLSSFHQDGFRFDRGPSLFTMPQYVTELFELCDEEATEHFQYAQLRTVCHYFWQSGERLNASADPELFSLEAANVFGVDVNRVKNALHASQEKYAFSGRTFLEKPLHKVDTWLNTGVLKTMANLGKMDLGITMNEVNEKQLEHPKLVQLFNRFATYNGSSPYQAPGILTVIPTFEHVYGTYLPAGGMYTITAELVKLAERQGVTFIFNQKVAGVKAHKKTVTQVVLESGEQVKCDLLINNSDINLFYRDIMPNAVKPIRTLKQEKSTSALIFYWGIEGDFEELGLHNIFFSKDYKAEFDALRRGAISDDFTIYINSTAKFVAQESPKGTENWFVMVNAPYDRGQNWEAEVNRIKTLTIRRLSAQLNIDLKPLIKTESTWSPPEIERDTGSHLGALYGSSSNSRWAAFLRHRNQSKEFKNLYFVGGSVHPGGGVPLALLSAKIAADLIPNPV